MTLLFRDPLFQHHATGHHPERPQRLQWINAQLEKAALVQACTLGTYQPLPEEAVLAIHAPGQVQQVKEVAARGGGSLDPDTLVSSASYEVALAAAGACAAAVDAVVQGKAPNALCLVRPPGHHATENRSMGFCLFNNVALAADHARRRLGLSRILIVDWDVHHGNGTQDIFYADPQITFFSIHRYGGGFYPGSGAADESGTGPGLGHTHNEPVPYGTARADYLDRFRSTLERVAGRSKPELVLLSAGFDAHAQDPIGNLGLEVEDFAVMSQSVLDVAQVHAGGRLVSCLEGGYNLQALAECVQAHLEQMLKTS
jgi:acetoin utilization deacetylase AcuC-like enzyme